MAFAVKAELHGLEKALASLARVRKGARGKIQRKALTPAVKHVSRLARVYAPAESGLLRRSLGTRVQVYRRSGAAVGLVGPRSGFRQTRAGRVRTALGKRILKGVTLGGRKNAVNQIRNPTKYAHLVELGRKGFSAKKAKVLAGPLRVYGRKVRAVAPRPFLKTAWDAGRAHAVALIRDGIAAGVYAEARGNG
jgi:hypothetical protein